MKSDEALAAARDLMTVFAEETGLASNRNPRRYLWTDAFAACNFMELFRRTGEKAWRDLALRLVSQVHRVLGRYRDDDSRTGWLSGLDETEGERHPTAGGLRIGKELKERGADEPFDEELEWERDGQYYHYLTKWMHALDRLGTVLEDPAFIAWGVELARIAHDRFVYVPKAGTLQRLYWKMSTDLSRPLVSSMGQHDPLDGLVTLSQLRGKGRSGGMAEQLSALDAAIDDLFEISRRQNLVTGDALGIGGLLFDACRMAQLHLLREFDRLALLEQALDAALLGLESFAVRSPLRLPAEFRLAFRELGLAIGLRGVERMRRLFAENPEAFDKSLAARIEAFSKYLPLGEGIESFWIDGANREGAGWREHRQINGVMLATRLLPEGFLSI